MITPLFQSSFALPAPSVDPTLPSLCPSDLPLVLLPVRLETRFFTQAGATELRVRVYPDKIHLDSHEPELLPGEIEWGRHYWDADWRARDDRTARATAWRQLADRFGAARAAWIARVLEPTNQRPSTPVAAGQPLSPAIAFPVVTPASDPGGSAWRHAAQARLLPDRWIAVLQSGGTTTQVTGNVIQTPLAVGPDPKATLGSMPDDQLTVDPEMKWMVDFADAEAKGMALRMPVTDAALAAGGLDSLLVFGVAGPPNGANGATQLAGLLDAHHYTDGLAFIRYGTATNNTEDGRAAPVADDAAHERSYATEVESDPAALDAPSNALRIGAALGLPAASVPRVLGRVDQASARHELDMRSMNAALWPVGWGYYLSNMMGFAGTGLTPALAAWARDHFVTHVRAGGPYPVLRCGRQPYGVLPVTSLDLWKPRVGDEQLLAPDAWLRDMLVKLRDNVWRPRLSEAFRLGRRQSPQGEPDADLTDADLTDADLADVMRTDGVSSRYGTRSVFGRHYLQHLRAFLGEDLQASGFIATEDALAFGLLQRLGLPTGPRLARAVAAETAWPVTAPLVPSGEASPSQGRQAEYIGDLLGKSTIQSIIDDRGSSNAPYSLLQVLLRHAMLREIADAAAQIAASGGDVATLLRDVELVDLVTGAPKSDTWKRLLGRSVANDPGARTIGEFLEQLTTFTAPAVASLGDFRRSLAHLKGLDSETLLHLMQGTLDLSSHRLDAWVTSFATKRLAAIRATAPNGVYVGAYGWVENLRPLPASSTVPVTTLPVGEAGPLVRNANDGGFIHAPSATHAAAAALLRNGHLGPTGVPQPTSPFAIDLSSRRAREAERLLDGVCQGQPLGALLGYRLERSLHTVGADAAIAHLRTLAPLSARPLPRSSAPVEAIAPNNVVDGLALFQMWQTDATAVTGPLARAGIGQLDIDSVTLEMPALGDAIDGLSDALTAEAAYQIARGNTSRVASTLAAIAQGDAPPPELEVARTPRSGIALTHRLLVLFSGNNNLNTPGWLNWNTGARSSADQLLNFWAGKLLGDVGKVRCTVERIDDASGAVAETRFPLSELLITPLDVVYGVESLGATEPEGSLGVIEQQVLYHAKHKPGGFDVGASIRLQHARPSDLAPGELTLFDVLEQARAIQQLLARARAAEPEDLNPPDRTGTGAIDLTDLDARVVRAENGLNAAHKQLVALAAKPATTTAESLRLALLKLGGYGVGPAVPAIASGEDAATRAALLTQARTMLKASTVRMDRMLTLRAVPVATDERVRRDQLVERMRSVFGPSFVVLPRFSCGATAGPELTSAIAASKQLQGGDPLAAHGWFARIARVRDTVARLGACVRGAEVLGAGERLNLTVAQLPFQSGDRWVGLAPNPGTEMTAGKLSLVLQTVMPINVAQPFTGLLVDEWTEVVPSARETTAIAFQLNPPDAAPPQNVLVAVPPVPGVDWTSDTLRRVLVETLDLAKLRAIDPESLGETAQYLPGLYLAFNAKDDAVSTDFAPLTL